MQKKWQEGMSVWRQKKKAYPCLQSMATTMGVQDEARIAWCLSMWAYPYGMEARSQYSTS